jgi:hypothetical protein
MRLCVLCAGRAAEDGGWQQREVSQAEKDKTDAAAHEATQTPHQFADARGA